MLVGKSMTKVVVTALKDDSIFDAQEKMTSNKIRHLPVVDDKNHVIGIVTDRDIRSTMPSRLLTEKAYADQKEQLAKYKLKDIMTENPETVSLHYTIQDALLLIQEKRVGAFPVVDDQGVLKGIVSVRDLLNAFISVLGIKEAGVLLCVITDNAIGAMKQIVDVIAEEKISVGSILVARHWEKNKRAVFPYLLSLNVVSVKKRLKSLGLTLLDPMEWYIDQIPHNE